MSVKYTVSIAYFFLNQKLYIEKKEKNINEPIAMGVDFK